MRRSRRRRRRGGGERGTIIRLSKAALSPPEQFYMRDEGGEAGGGGGRGRASPTSENIVKPRSQEVVGDGKLYLTLHCHHPNDFYIKIGSYDSHLNDTLIVRGEVTRRVSGPQLLKRKEGRSGESNRRRLLTSRKPYRWAKPAHLLIT